MWGTRLVEGGVARGVRWWLLCATCLLVLGTSFLALPFFPPSLMGAFDIHLSWVRNSVVWSEQD